MTFPPRLPDPDHDGNPPDYFDQGAYEDAAWNDSGVIGLVIALVLVIGIIALTSWLDGITPSEELRTFIERAF